MSKWSLHNQNTNKQNYFEKILKLLQQRIQSTTLHKVRTHANIESNEKAKKLAKESEEKKHYDSIRPYEFTYSILYYYQKDRWHSKIATLDKSPIRYLEKNVMKLDRGNNLEATLQFPKNMFSEIKTWSIHGKCQKIIIHW